MSSPIKPRECAPTRAALLLVMFAAVTSGCMVGPDYHRPNTPVPDAWHQELEEGTSRLDAEGVRQWWTILGDPTLDSLVLRAKEQNLDLYAATQRICQAREQLNVARSARWAQVENIGSFRNSKAPARFSFVPNAFDFWTSGFDVAWEPDVWGRVRRDVEANCANYQSTVEGYRDLMVTLYADVARNYIDLRTFQERLQYTRQNVEIQRASLELAVLRVEGGVSPILDSHQATANLASTEAEIPPLETAIQQTLNRLAVLLGEYPRSLHCELLESAPIPTVPSDLPTVLPCDVVRQRPDIRQAERQLAARTAEVGIAIADLYPQFSINGSFRFSAQKFANVFNSKAFNYEVGPNFRWALFQGGRIRANITSSECAVCEALATYEQTLLLAAEEVENAVVAFNNEIERRHALARSVAAAQKSLESVLEIYRAGNTDFQNVLVTQQTLFIEQNRLADSEGQVVVNLVSFYKALGGGWDPVHHCEPRCVRLPCPPDCPTEAAPSQIPAKSYLLDDQDDAPPEDEPEIEDRINEESNGDDSDASDGTNTPAESLDKTLPVVYEEKSAWHERLVPWRGITFGRSISR